MVITLPVQAQFSKPVLPPPTQTPAPTPTKPVLPPPDPTQPTTKQVGIWQETTPGAYHQSGTQRQDFYSNYSGAYVWSSDPARPNTYMWHGPNLDLPTSRLYQVCWNLRITVNNTVMTLDVAYNGGTVSKSSVLNLPASSSYDRYCLDFYASPGQTFFEFRAMVHQGTAYIDDVRVAYYL